MQVEDAATHDAVNAPKPTACETTTVLQTDGLVSRVRREGRKEAHDQTSSAEHTETGTEESLLDGQQTEMFFQLAILTLPLH